MGDSISQSFSHEPTFLNRQIMVTDQDSCPRLYHPILFISNLIMALLNGESSDQTNEGKTQGATVSKWTTLSQEPNVTLWVTNTSWFFDIYGHFLNWATLSGSVAWLTFPWSLSPNTKLLFPETILIASYHKLTHSFSLTAHTMQHLRTLQTKERGSVLLFVLILPQRI